MTGHWPQGDRTHPGASAGQRSCPRARIKDQTLALTELARPITFYRGGESADQTRRGHVRSALTYASVSSQAREEER
jgi:hypothetical protein